MNVAEKLITIAENQQKVYESGETKGYTTGYETGHQVGYEDGKQAEYDRFWDSYQNNGNRENYQYAFAGQGWTNETFKPKYDIVPTDAYYLFKNAQLSGDLVTLLDELGIVLDFSKCKNLNNMFSYAQQITRIGVVDLTNKPSCYSMFEWCSNLKTIDKVIINKDTPLTSSSGFCLRCEALENIAIEGVWGGNYCVFTYCTKLTHESLMSIINSLADRSVNPSGAYYRLQLGSANLAKLTADEKAIATNKGWSIS